MSNLDFLTEHTRNMLNNDEKTDYCQVFQPDEKRRLEEFKKYFSRLPKEFQQGLIAEAQKQIDEEDRAKEEKEKKLAEQTVKSAPIMSNQKALDMKTRLRNKLLKKKGLLGTNSR